MGRIAAMLALLALCAPLFAGTVRTGAGAPQYRQQVLVTYKMPFTDQEAAQTAAKYGTAGEDRDAVIASLERGYGIKRVSAQASGVPFVCYAVDAAASVTATAAALEEEAIVAHAQPNYVFYALYTPLAGGPPDPAYRKNLAYKPAGLTNSEWEQWYLWQTRADRVYADGLVNPNAANAVTVAVLDTGVDYLHEDLSGMTVTGKSFITGVTDPMDDDTDGGHGTHCAGIIAANTGTLTGMASMAGANVTWTARPLIMPVKVLDSAGLGDDAVIAQALIWAADNGAKVINMSLGGAAADDVLKAACTYAAGKGCLLIAAAGNDNSATMYPAAYPNVMAVAATELITDGSGRTSDAKAYFSCYGKIDVAAPGVSILSASNTGSYSSWDGTSFAAPVVSGLAALIWMKYPELTADGVRSLIEKSADDAGATGYDEKFGWGRVNAYRALTLQTTGASTGGAAVKTYNFPNPFSPGSGGITRIVFIPAAQTPALVTIYDAGGDKVWEKSVPSEQVRPNMENYLDWDGKNSEGVEAASGVYFYIVKVNDGYGKNKIAVLY